jgi:inhibitor of KinA
MREFRIVAAGDAALLVEFPQRIDPALSTRAVAMSRAIKERCAGRIRDVVVGYASVTVYFDPLVTDVSGLTEEIHRAADLNPETPVTARTVIEVPVCYGGELGPDLAGVAAFAQATEAETIQLHCACPYRVYVVGFMPGFAYMASLDPRLAIARRPTPRTRVPAGSVAIAAGQTGIYPLESPGGWHLIGRTQLKPFDEHRSEPFLFKPGDLVRFRPIDRDEFDRSA